MGGGGSVDAAFERSGKMLEPLGLEMTEHPSIGFRPRVLQPGFDAEMRGKSAFQGVRHGRAVMVQAFASGGALTTLAAPLPAFEVKAKGERLKAADGAPPEVTEVLKPLRASSCWKGVQLEAGPEGIAVTRKKDTGSDWLRDLWLAERLADAVGERQSAATRTDSRL
jgi:hypothetical protein